MFIYFITKELLSFKKVDDVIQSTRFKILLCCYKRYVFFTNKSRIVCLYFYSIETAHYSNWTTSYLKDKYCFSGISCFLRHHLSHSKRRRHPFPVLCSSPSADDGWRFICGINVKLATHKKILSCVLLCWWDIIFSRDNRNTF